MKRIALLVALSLAAWNVSACKCIQQTVAEQFEKSGIVFVGTLREGQDLSERAKGTVIYDVSRALKGGVRAGAPVTIDPLFETDCTAPLVPGATVLVFAYSEIKAVPATSACSSRLAAPFVLDGKNHQPEREVTEFLSSLPEK